jgi:hypothetical protein
MLAGFLRCKLSFLIIVLTATTAYCPGGYILIEVYLDPFLLIFLIMPLPFSPFLSADPFSESEFSFITILCCPYE